jgi:hypothetical protein
MHTQTGHQAIQHQLEKRRQQHELDGVFEQGTEIANFSYQAIAYFRRFYHGRALHRRTLYLSGKNRVNAPNLSGMQHAKRNPHHTRRMVKKAVQQGRSERRGEAYPGPYVEPLSDARTTLAAFFNILL